MGGVPPLGYDVREKRLVANRDEAETVRTLFRLYLKLGTAKMLVEEADSLGLVTKKRVQMDGSQTGGHSFTRGHLYQLLTNPIYVGKVAHKDITYPGQHDAIIERETFDAVQRLLDSKAAERRSATNAKAPSLLTGLVYDETGDRLSPTHANKKGRRYRYYISKRLVLRIGSTEDGWRLPAKELDRAVAQMISDFLRDEIRIVDALDLIGTAPDRMRNILRRAAAGADDLGHEPPESKRRLLHRLLHRVTIHPGSIHIALKRSGLGSLVFGKVPDSAAYSEDLVDFTVPATLKRRGVEAKLVLSTVQGEIAAPDESSIALLVRAHRWLGQLAKGEIGSAREISRREKIDASEISRIIRLAFLAPDIVEAVLAGRQPVELTPRHLMRGELPLEWHRQRRLLGFPA